MKRKIKLELDYVIEMLRGGVMEEERRGRSSKV